MKPYTYYFPFFLFQSKEAKKIMKLYTMTEPNVIEKAYDGGLHVLNKQKHGN